LADKGITKIDLEVLQEAGFINATQLVKILGNGAVTVALDVTANAFSASAIKAIEAAGGKATVYGMTAEEA
jgi:large subunit ribosomal protein L15